jgi:anti-anti-sigma factor
MDLRQVSFLGSMGLRSLVSPARAIKSLGGKMVLFGPNEMVEKGFEDERHRHHDSSAP